MNTRWIHGSTFLPLLKKLRPRRGTRMPRARLNTWEHLPSPPQQAPPSEGKMRAIEGDWMHPRPNTRQSVSFPFGMSTLLSIPAIPCDRTSKVNAYRDFRLNLGFLVRYCKRQSPVSLCWRDIEVGNCENKVRARKIGAIPCGGKSPGNISTRSRLNRCVSFLHSPSLEIGIICRPLFSFLEKGSFCFDSSCLQVHTLTKAYESNYRYLNGPRSGLTESVSASQRPGRPLWVISSSFSSFLRFLVGLLQVNFLKPVIIRIGHLSLEQNMIILP